MSDGSVVIAAITSCTNTSNPTVMVGAGLIARRALDLGLRVPPYVKTSLAPGSKVVTAYLDRAGLLAPLATLGFDVVGFGCTTCIGNSGPLIPAVSQQVREDDLYVAAVLSGNRNFDARINIDTRAAYLASPMLVVAYALAGRMDLDLSTQPLGKGPDGSPVFLRDLWPSPGEVRKIVEANLDPGMFRDQDPWHRGRGRPLGNARRPEEPRVSVEPRLDVPRRGAVPEAPAPMAPEVRSPGPRRAGAGRTG